MYFIYFLLPCTNLLSATVLIAGRIFGLFIVPVFFISVSVASIIVLV